MNLPMQIYDFIGVLIPGVVALIIIKVEYPAWIIWQLESPTAQLAILFAMSYAGGHLLQGSSRYTWKYTWKLINLVKNLRKSHFKESQIQSGIQSVSNIGATTTEYAILLDTNSRNESLLFGRHYNLSISRPFEKEIKIAFKNVFNIDMATLTHEEAFALIFSLAQEKMGQRHIFVAIANLNRCLTNILTLYLLYLFAKLIYIIIRPDMVLLIPQTIALFSLIVFSLIFAIQNTDYFKQMSDQIPFAAFLSWYKEQKLKQHKSEY